MWPRTNLHDRAMIRTILGLTAAYTLALGFTFRVSSIPDFLGIACMFAGPMIIACVLAMVMTHPKAHRVILGFQVAYIFATLTISISTFSGERDAQYQLQLLLIPLLGFLGVTVAGVLAALRR